MRDLKIRQTAAEALRCAEAGAIAALGKRGDEARNAMNQGARREAQRMSDVRWKAIVRGARATRIDPLTERDVALECGGDEARALTASRTGDEARS